MASTTRLKTSQSSTPYLRITADEDYASTDVAHTDPKTTGLGSSVDIPLHTDGDTTWDTTNSVVLADANLTALAGTNATSLLLIHIKHSGYKEAAKTNASTAVLKVFMRASDAASYFTLEPQESITLHGFGSGSDTSDEWGLAASDSAGLYVEVTTCKAA